MADKPDRERERSSADKPAQRDKEAEWFDQYRDESTDPLAALREHAAKNPPPCSVPYCKEVVRKQREHAARARCEGIIYALERQMAEFASAALSTTLCPRVFRVHRWIQGGEEFMLQQLEGRGLTYDFARNRLRPCKPNPDFDTRFTPPELTAENHLRALRTWQEKTAGSYLRFFGQVAYNGNPEARRTLRGSNTNDVELVDYLNETFRKVPFASGPGGARSFVYVWARRPDPFDKNGVVYRGCDVHETAMGAYVRSFESDDDPELLKCT